MRDPRSVRCTYYLESEIEPEKAAAIMAGEQSSGTFLPVPGESARIRERHAARISDVQELGFCRPSLPSRANPEKVRAALVNRPLSYGERRHRPGDLADCNRRQSLRAW